MLHPHIHIWTKKIVSVYSLFLGPRDFHHFIIQSNYSLTLNLGLLACLQCMLIYFWMYREEQRMKHCSMQYAQNMVSN